MRKVFKDIIPNKFTIGGVEYNVNFVTNEDNISNFGRIDCFNAEVKLQNERNSKPISRKQLTQTFWQEAVHGILDAMGESELNNNEKFVTCFSSMLNEVIQSCEVEDEK